MSRIALGLLALLVVARVSHAQVPTPPNVEVQPRGPLHEAYAQPFDVKPEPGAPVPKEPPPPVTEEPPDQKPEAENAQWIPGYWAWDSEQQQYLWISGVYRVAPPGRSYVPGYWAQTPEGWRWVAGFWGPSQAPENTYTPQPPASLDNGPSLPAPDNNAAYIPGGWVYRDARWLWRPGYWASFQLGRVWNPPRYQWTPNGYAYVDGYWDYPLQDRGLIFAPVTFNQPLYLNPGYAYQPNNVVNFGALLDSAFVLGNSFYFGNYYGPSYARLGYRPWFAGMGRYDPLFAYHGWRTQRQNPNWIGQAQKTYAARGSGQLKLNGTPTVAPLKLAANANPVRLVPLSATQRGTQKANGQQIRTKALNRRQLETARLGPQALAKTSPPVTVPRNMAPRATSKVVTPATNLKKTTANTLPRATTTQRAPSSFHLPATPHPVRVSPPAHANYHAPAHANRAAPPRPAHAAHGRKR